MNEAMSMKVPWSDKEWQRVAVYGLGLSGRAAVELLRRHEVDVVVFDDRPREELDLADWGSDPGTEVRAGGRLGELEGLDGVVASPGIPEDRPLFLAARQRGVPIIAEVELAYPWLDGEIVAITGSNGKSTTTALVGAMLEAAGRRVEVCGNIGSALSSRVRGEAGRVFVVELSSFQLERVDRFHAGSAALLNISPDHLDRHHDLESYLAAKATIFARQNSEDLAILNARDPLVAELEPASHRRFFASRGTVEDGCYLSGEAVLEVTRDGGTYELFRRSDVPLPGIHNLENAMAAALLARAHGAEPRDVAAGLKSFRGLPHRLERVRERRGALWFDDSKGTNLAATVRSLEGFEDDQVHIILGGQFKGGDLSELASVAARKACRAYLIGEAAPVFAQALANKVVCESVETLERAVARAAEGAQPGEIVLLSPACASFDQFDNFAQRGRVFQRLVKALPGGELGS